MKRKGSKRTAGKEAEMVIRVGKDAVLSRTQVEFNRLMKQLEAAKGKLAREQARLDDALETSIRELMPMVEQIHRTKRELVLGGARALKQLKLTAVRRRWLEDLIAEKAGELVNDSVGLTPEEVGELEVIYGEFTPESELEDDTDYDLLCELIEESALDAGFELDLSGLDGTEGREAFDRAVRERVAEATMRAEGGGGEEKKARKPGKAQLAKERRRLEIEEAKKRDLRSLFKQLAKAFHPDLEPDPEMREHKKGWMQRLNTAYEGGDLREMLQLEMEWLGEESANLAAAGDEKLKVYCMVLKEQILGMGERIFDLLDEPQYGPLVRFRDPYHGTLASPVTLKKQLGLELAHVRGMAAVLDRNDAAARQMIYGWADERARYAKLGYLR